MKPMVIDGKYHIGLMYDVDKYRKCTCDNLGIVRKTLNNGTIQTRVQCKDCGRNVRVIKDLVAESAKKNGCLIGIWDASFEVDNLKEWELQAEQIKIKQAKWKEKYSDHIESQKWKEIREHVLNRDKYVCQGCLANKASHVHHLTYDHVGDELYFELVSLCPGCHERTHDGN